MFLKFTRLGGQRLYLNFAEILSIEAEGDHSLIITTKGQKFLAEESIFTLDPQLQWPSAITSAIGQIKR